jgi:N-acetylglucosaminyl-diphospho-decaprenol L-rhamnosyltransferase
MSEPLQSPLAPNPAVDVVVVSYNSREQLRGCVQPLASVPGVAVVVVDNASQDGSAAALADLPVRVIPLEHNGGFAHGCNVGWRAGNSKYVLFLNPDARLDAESLARLAEVLDRSESVGIVGPRIMARDGALDFSQRCFPRLRSTFAHALFLNRAFPRAQWASELVREPTAYERAGSPEWISGACMLVRRSLLERLGGWDEEFFLYCEDKDLCFAARAAGYDIRFDPSATAVHQGGASSDSTLMPVLAASRIRYAQKHRGRTVAWLERVGVGLTALTHIVVTRGGMTVRSGHAASLRAVASRRP